MSKHAKASEADAAWFMKVYPEAAQSLEQKLSSAIYTGNEYSGNSDSATGTETSIRGKLVRIIARQAGGVEVVRLLTNDHIVILKKESNGEYSIVKVQDGGHRDLLESMHTKSTFPFAAYCIFEQTIRDFIHQPGFEIVSTQWIQTDDKYSMFRIDWESPYRHPESHKEQTRVGWFTFVPDHSWILKEYGFAYSKEATGRRHGVVDYQWVGGRPEFRSFKSFSQNGDVKVELESCVITSQEFQSPPESNFALSSFGLPNTLFGEGENPQDRSKTFLHSSIILWCIVVASYLIYWWRSRR